MSARFMVAMTLALLLGGLAQADQTFTVTTTITAQEQAETNARTGRMAHCRFLNGKREGVGFSSSSAQQAIESSCFWRDAQRGHALLDDPVAATLGVAAGSR